MVSLRTPICDFGWNAVDFDLPGVDGKRYRIADVRGENGLLVSNDPGTDAALPQTRQEHVVQFIHSPTAAISITGGAGPDTFNVISTNQVGRTGLDGSLSAVKVATTTPGVTGTTSEVQHLVIGDSTDVAVKFRLRFGTLDKTEDSSILKTPPRELIIRAACSPLSPRTH